jgi:hypothetical protein
LRWINQTTSPIKPPAASPTTIQTQAGVPVSLPSPFVVVGATTTAVTAVVVGERTLVVTGAGVVETTTVVDVVTVERVGLSSVVGGCATVCVFSGRETVAPRVAVERLPATCPAPSPPPQPATAMLVRRPRTKSAAGAKAFASPRLRTRLPELVIPIHCTAEAERRHRPKGMTILRELWLRLRHLHGH